MICGIIGYIDGSSQDRCKRWMNGLVPDGCKWDMDSLVPNGYKWHFGDFPEMTNKDCMLQPQK